MYLEGIFQGRDTFNRPCFLLIQNILYYRLRQNDIRTKTRILGENIRFISLSPRFTSKPILVKLVVKNLSDLKLSCRIDNSPSRAQTRCRNSCSIFIFSRWFETVCQSAQQTGIITAASSGKTCHATQNRGLQKPQRMLLVNISSPEPMNLLRLLTLFWPDMLKSIIEHQNKLLVKILIRITTNDNI